MHKFSVGQNVLYTSNMVGRTGAQGSYTIVRVLPIESDERCRYRIKSASETFERVADETQLSEA